MITQDELKKDVLRWAKKTGMKPVEIHVRETRRKWASCSSRGRITLNKAILGESRRFLKEVIVSELVHLKYPNHGKMFKMLLKTYMAMK